MSEGKKEKIKGSTAGAVPFASGQPISSATRAACDWPVGQFRFFDSPGEHDPCYVVMPDGCSLPVNHHNKPGVDIARAKFIVTACNAHDELVARLEATLHTLGLMADAFPLGSATRNTLEDECASIRAALALAEPSST